MKKKIIRALEKVFENLVKVLIRIISIKVTSAADGSMFRFCRIGASLRRSSFQEKWRKRAGQALLTETLEKTYRLSGELRRISWTNWH